MLDVATCGKLARQLDEARRLRREIEPLSKTITELDLDDAYRIQRVGIGLARRTRRGHRRVQNGPHLEGQARADGPCAIRLRRPDGCDAYLYGADFQVARGIHGAARSYPPAAWC